MEDHDDIRVVILGMDQANVAVFTLIRFYKPLLLLINLLGQPGQGIDIAHRANGALRPAAVSVIPISFIPRRSATSAMHPTYTIAPHSWGSTRKSGSL